MDEVEKRVYERQQRIRSTKEIQSKLFEQIGNVERQRNT